MIRPLADFEDFDADLRRLLLEAARDPDHAEHASFDSDALAITYGPDQYARVALTQRAPRPEASGAPVAARRVVRRRWQD